MQRYSAIKSQLVRVIIIILPQSMLHSSVHGFTRKLLADYSSRDADNISHYVVLIQRNDDEWLRFEKPFPEACIDGTCAM